MQFTAQLDVDVVALEAEDEVTCLVSLTAPVPEEIADRLNGGRAHRGGAHRAAPVGRPAQAAGPLWCRRAAAGMTRNAAGAAGASATSDKDADHLVVRSGRYLSDPSRVGCDPLPACGPTDATNAKATVGP